MTFHLLPSPPTLICMKLIRHLVSVVSHSHWHWHCRSPLQPATDSTECERDATSICVITIRVVAFQITETFAVLVYVEVGGEEDDEEASPGITPHDRLLSPFALATRICLRHSSSNNNIHSSQVQVTKGDTLFSAIPQPIQESTPARV